MWVFCAKLCHDTPFLMVLDRFSSMALIADRPAPQSPPTSLSLGLGGVNSFLVLGWFAAQKLGIFGGGHIMPCGWAACDPIFVTNLHWHRVVHFHYLSTQIDEIGTLVRAKSQCQ